MPTPSVYVKIEGSIIRPHFQTKEMSTGLCSFVLFRPIRHRRGIFIATVQQNIDQCDIRYVQLSPLSDFFRHGQLHKKLTLYKKARILIREFGYTQGKS